MLILYRQLIGACLASLLCVVGVISLQWPRLQKNIGSSQTISIADIKRDVEVERIRLEILQKMPAFGYENMLANGVYLSFLQYFGNQAARQHTGYSLSPEFFEVILKNDPRFRLAYLSLSTSTSMYAAMPKRAVNITATGLQSLNPFLPKQSYYIWRYKGIDELLFLGESKAAQKSFQNSANWAKEHNDEESQMIAQLSQDTANFLEKNPSSKTAQISVWGMVLQNGVDKHTRDRVIQEIEKLGGTVIQTPRGLEIIFPPED